MIHIGDSDDILEVLKNAWACLEHIHERALPTDRASVLETMNDIHKAAVALEIAINESRAETMDEDKAAGLFYEPPVWNGRGNPP